MRGTARPTPAHEALKETAGPASLVVLVGSGEAANTPWGRIPWSRAGLRDRPAPRSDAGPSSPSIRETRAPARLRPAARPPMSLFHLLTSLPDTGVRTTAAVIVAIGDGATFPTRRTPRLLRRTRPRHQVLGHLHPRRARAPPRQPTPQTRPVTGRVRRDRLQVRPISQTYYDRQRARGKTHTQAILRLARQRVNVIHAMIRTGALYEPRNPDDVALAA